ncbi:hypothetical protein CBM2605_A230097 [Cupriavidus neocaledonicus]|uniref:Uncharacterized protein n=1 Tax=Cupriavidus neocaledonicus TaxID=1040979 RepID=A0ABY1V0A1_9BURK|nr:hypothetical protein CBM2605_A230097 [Cupriavidus neocaledonicus]
MRELVFGARHAQGRRGAHGLDVLRHRGAAGIEYLQRGALAQQVGLHHGFGAFGVARLERGKHAQVLGAGFLDPPRQLQALVARQPQHLAQVADQPAQPAVARQPLDRFMDLGVGLVVGVDIAGLRITRQVGVQAVEGIEVGAGGVAGRLIGTAPFQQRHQREDLVQVLLGQFIDETAAARLQPHQAFGGEHLERLAQRRARDAERFGHRAFIDPCARHQRMRVDHGAQPVCHFQVQRLLDDAHAISCVARAPDSVCVGSHNS